MIANHTPGVKVFPRPHVLVPWDFYSLLAKVEDKGTLASCLPVYACLAALANRDTGRCKVGVAKIATLTKRNRKVVMRATAALHAAGLVQKIPGPNGVHTACVYIVNPIQGSYAKLAVGICMERLGVDAAKVLIICAYKDQRALDPAYLAKCTHIPAKNIHRAIAAAIATGFVVAYNKRYAMALPIPPAPPMPQAPEDDPTGTEFEEGDSLITSKSVPVYLKVGTASTSKSGPVEPQSWDGSSLKVDPLNQNSSIQNSSIQNGEVGLVVTADPAVTSSQNNQVTRTPAEPAASPSAAPTVGRGGGGGIPFVSSENSSPTALVRECLEGFAAGHVSAHEDLDAITDRVTRLLGLIHYSFAADEWARTLHVAASKSDMATTWATASRVEYSLCRLHKREADQLFAFADAPF